MLYRALGRTGLKVSQLGFGAMRLPMIGEGKEAKVDREKSTPMFHRAFEAGVNYVDTATMYCNSDSQCAVGEAVKSWRGGRESLIVSTKNPYYEQDEKEWWTNLENSLTRLQTSYIDIYNQHGVNWNSYVEKVEPRLSKWMQKAKDQKLIRHICCSFHDKNDGLEKLVATGFPESITLQYNLLDRQLEPGIAKAHEKGIGVVVMGPVGGGRLGTDLDVFKDAVPTVRRVPELAVRFVLSNPNVSVALSGMSTMEQVQENIGTCSESTGLAAGEYAIIEEHLKRLKAMADLYCTGCDYCKPCPNKVNISWVFSTYNQGRVYGVWGKGHYAWMMREGIAADACVDCGECEPKCPQKIDIRKQLKEAHAALTAA